MDAWRWEMWGWELISGILFSDYFNIDQSVLNQYGALNVCLSADLPLFIDPFLLFASENEDYKNAFFTQKKYDSIVKYYNATDANGKLELAEKKLEDENRQLKEQNEKYIDYILYGVIISLLLLLYFAFRLYQSNMAKRILVEKENTRIHNEIERLTQALDEKGNASLNLSNYNLTDRQKEIIELIRSGLTNKEIASKLFISENTVKYHLKIIYEILDVEHRSAIR